MVWMTSLQVCLPCALSAIVVQAHFISSCTASVYFAGWQWAYSIKILRLAMMHVFPVAARYSISCLFIVPLQSVHAVFLGKQPFA